MARPRPDRPIPPEARRGDPGHDQDHPDREAALVERGDGAHAEQISDEANLRADPTPPGQAPADADDEAAEPERDRR